MNEGGVAAVGSVLAAVAVVGRLKRVAEVLSVSRFEAFVKTLERDYVRISPLSDAPHSLLRMRSPREFIRAQIQ